MKWVKWAVLCGILVVGSPAGATVNSAQTLTTANGNGVTTAFTYPFIIPYQADGVTPAVVVQVTNSVGVTTTLTPGQYSITGVNNPSGGTVVYNPGGVPLPTGNIITISRALNYLQPTAVSNYNFYPHTVEQIADQLDMQIQQLNTRFGSSGQVTGSAITLSNGANSWAISVDTNGNLVTTRLTGSGYVNVGGGAPVYIPILPGSVSYANDTLAAAGGISVGQVYRNGSVMQDRVN